MGMERDVLRKIFSRLKKEYQAKAWQIEYVDLRWGIRSEASVDNQTMRICLKELKRCQELSPQPNFIILLGDRYGWIPLPELITCEEMNDLMLLATDEEADLIWQWYDQDDNQLPAKCFYLLPKNYDGANPSLFAEQIERPLRKLMQRYANTLPPDYPRKGVFCHSATAQEVDQGALKSSNPDAKVLAYFRSLANVPQDKVLIYSPSSIDEVKSMWQLKCNLRERLSHGHIYEEKDVDYHSYTHITYQKRFERGMEEHLRCMIEEEIAHWNMDDEHYEWNEHLDFAFTETSSFVGRVQELKLVTDYICSDKADNPLWLMADNGMGKSALMAKVATLCSEMEDTVVIARFCGRTKYSCNAQYLMLYLWKQIRSLFDKSPYTFEPNMWRVLFGKESGLFDSDFLIDAFDYFKYGWKHLLPPTRYVVLIDGMDELNVKGVPWFPQMEWLPQMPLPANVKVVLTSAPSPDFAYEPNHVRIVKDWISPLRDEKERELFLRDYLQHLNRRLTQRQWGNFSWDLALMPLKKSTPLYFSLFAHELAQYTSEQSIPTYGNDFTQLTLKVLERLMLPQNHGEDAVKMTLALIATTCLGVTDDEMNRLPAMDEKYYRHFCQTSFHVWQDADLGERSLPAILWTRLKWDLQFFLASQSSAAGYYLMFRHEPFARIVRSEFLSNEWLTRAEDLWIVYFSLQWQKEDKHALYELPHLLAIRYRRTNAEADLQRWLALFKDYRFIMWKKKLLPDELLNDFNEWSTVRKQLPQGVFEFISQLENEAMSLPSCTDDEFTYRVNNLPKESLLRGAAEEYSALTLTPPVLSNVLCNLTLQNTIRFYFDVHKVGNQPLISSDGIVVISLMQDDKVAVFLNLENGLTGCLAQSPDTIIWHGISRTLNRYAMLKSNRCSVIDMTSGQVIFQSNVHTHLQWASLSTNGEKLIYGGEEETAHLVDLNTMQQLEFTTPIGQSLLSDDGSDMWEVTETYLRHWDTAKWKQHTLTFANLFKQNGDMEKLVENMWTLIGCSRRTACVQTTHVTLVVQLNDNDTWSCSSLFNPNEPITYAVIDEQEETVWLFALNGSSIRFQTTIYKIDVYKTYNIDAITNDRRWALSMNEGVLFDYQKQKEHMVQTGIENSGVNTLAASNRGETFILSMGKRHTEINGNSLLCIEKREADYTDRCIKTHLVELCDYVSACALSPADDYYSYSLHGSMPFGNFVIARRADDVATYQEVNAPSCTAIQFSTDSRYVVAANGDYIADPMLSIYLFSTQGEKLGTYEEKDNYDNNTAHNLCLSPCNRYLLTGDKFECQIIDLVNMRSLGLKGIKIGGRRLHTLDLFPAWGFHPNGNWAYVSSEEKLYKIKLDTGHITSYPEARQLQCISPCGEYLFVSNKEGEAWRLPIYEHTTDVEIRIATHVWHIAPCVCGKYLYIINDRQEVLLTDYNGKVLQKAYFDHCIRYKVTAVGLAIAQAEGRVLLFAPLPQHQSHQAVVFPHCRWNLKEKRQEASTVVCPVCGAVHQWQASKDMICQNCGTTLVLGRDDD